MKVVIFVTTVFLDVDNGPGTYARYLWQQFRSQPDFRFLVIAPGDYPDNHEIIGFAAEDKGASMYHAIERVLIETISHYRASDIIVHLNIPHLLSRVPDGVKFLVQANDYEAAYLSIDVFTLLRRNKLGRLLKLYWRRFREERVYKSADLVLANSRYTKKVLSKEYSLAPDQIKVLYKAVDLELFAGEHPEAAAYTAGIGKSTPLHMVFVGTDWKRKGLDILHESVQLLQSQGYVLEVVVVGTRDFAANNELAEKIHGSAVADCFEFTGRVGRDLIRDCYLRAHVAVLPSRGEALGVSVIEALATGTPVIASRVGGIPEILEGSEAGLLCDLSAEDFAEKLRQVIEQPGVLQQMSDKCRDRAEVFSTSNMLSGVEDIYCSLWKSEEDA